MDPVHWFIKISPEHNMMALKQNLNPIVNIFSGSLFFSRANRITASKIFIDNNGVSNRMVVT